MPPRIRTLKPDVWQDRDVGHVSIGARLLFVGLITQADDEGRFRAEPALLRAALFPFDAFSTTAAGTLPGMQVELDLEAWLAELEQAGKTSERPGLIRLWHVRGERFGDLPGFAKHQRIQRPSPSLLPDISNQDKNRPSSTTTNPLNATNSEPTGGFAGISDHPPEGSVTPPAGVGKGIGEGLSVSDPSDPPPHSSRRSSVRRADGMKVWEAYARHHPRSVLTPKRRDLIRRRIAEGFEPDRLVAAIEGNHVDPHCNGENDRHREYHDLELILRDAGHIEGYEALWLSKQNGGARPAAERQVAAAVARFRAVEAEQGRDGAEEWLDAVHTPEIVDRVLEAVAS